LMFMTNSAAINQSGNELSAVSDGCAMPATSTAATNPPNHTSASRCDTKSTANSGPSSAQMTTALPPTNPPSESCRPNGSAMINASSVIWNQRNEPVRCSRARLADDSAAYASGHAADE